MPTLELDRRSADRTLYVCVAIDEGLPVWVPMTQIKQMYRHPQNGTALEWTVQHDLNANPVLIQVFDADGKVDRVRMKTVSPIADFSYDYQDLTFVPVAAPAD